MHEIRVHTVDLLAAAFDLLKRHGYEIRETPLEGRAGAACTLKGRKLIFLDPTASPRQQLDRVIETIQDEPGIRAAEMPTELAFCLNALLRDAAA